MSYRADVVADSISPHGIRITTIVATFPRFILAEVNTHRVFSRNSASSRAIPPEKLIQRVIDDPFVPDTFNRRVKGMGGGAPIEVEDQQRAKNEWLAASREAVVRASRLVEIGVDKARVNRLLEPFLWHTALITSTEWDNFFALRQPSNDDPVPQQDHGAQPEFQIVARMMRDAMRDSTPRELGYGQWHLPYVDERVDKDKSMRYGSYAPPINVAMVSAGRCFTVSYDRLDEMMEEAPKTGYERCSRGSEAGHWSPLEHPAMALRPGPDQFGGPSNFQDWVQLRKFFPDEDNAQAMMDLPIQV